MAWMDDKGKDRDIIFAVRVNYTFADGFDPPYSGKYGPYLTFKGAEKKAKQLMLEHHKYKDNPWYKKMYTDADVTIEATKVEWMQVAHIEEVK